LLSVVRAAYGFSYRGPEGRPGVGEQGMVRAHEWDVSRRLSRPPGRSRPWWGSHPAPVRRGLDLDWESAGGHAVVTVAGELDDLTSPRLEASLAERTLAGCAVLEVDLREVPSTGSVGLSALLGVRHRCSQRGIALRVRGAQPSVWRAFEDTGLDGVFTVVDEPAAAPPVQQLTLF
jgi:anti-anti-sigma factor